MNAQAPLAIRVANVGDAAAVRELAVSTFVDTFGHSYKKADLDAFLAEGRSVAVYTRLLEDPKVRIWTAAFGNEPPIGYVVVGSCKLPVTNLEPSAGEVRELYVRSGYQNHRIGTQLLTIALEWLRAQNYSPLYVGVWSENLGAQRVYQRFGFEKVAEYGFPVGGHVDREFILKRTAG